MGAKEQLKSILKDNVAFKKVGNLSRGALSHKGLYKVKFSARVFEKKTLEAKKHYNFLYLIDCSGSMVYRNSCMIQSLDALEKCLNITKDIGNNGVYGFNKTLSRAHPLGRKISSHKQILDIKDELHAQASFSGCNQPYKGVYPTPVLKMTRKKIEESSENAGNHDGYLISQLIPEIQSHKGETLLIIISDGHPHCDDASKDCGHKGCGKDSDLEKDLKQAVSELKKRKIKTIALGVYNNGVKKFYTHADSTHDSNMIEPLLVKLIKTQFRRSS